MVNTNREHKILCRKSIREKASSNINIDCYSELHASVPQ